MLAAFFVEATLPTARAVISALKKAGLPESKIVRAEAGQPEDNLPGFRVQVSPLERRLLHVYHIGKGGRSALSRYEAALSEAGFTVRKKFGGLIVGSRRVPTDREKSLHE